MCKVLLIPLVVMSMGVAPLVVDEAEEDDAVGADVDAAETVVGDASEAELVVVSPGSVDNSGIEVVLSPTAADVWPKVVASPVTVDD